MQITTIFLIRGATPFGCHFAGGGPHTSYIHPPNQTNLLVKFSQMANYL
jgi:hypothetical protein